LDRYAEGSLLAPKVLAVREHVRTCADCAALLHELKMVDGLLETLSAPPEPAPNFTFAVMAEVRSKPAPRPARIDLFRWAAGYVLAGWALIALWMNLAGISIASWGERAAAGFSSATAAFGSLSSSSLHAFGHQTPSVALFVTLLLLLDLGLAIGVALFHRTVRPHLAAVLAPLREVE